MGKETNIVLGHAADADGIEEYDNPLPDWWLGLFIFTIVWGVGYAIAYHWGFDHSQVKGYEAEMAAAAERWPTPDTPSAVTVDPASVGEGATVYAQTCAACHGPELGGGIGPSLVDAEWVHGSAPEQIVATISDGVAAKGMPAWGPILGPKKVSQVTAFILSKQPESAQ